MITLNSQQREAVDKMHEFLKGPAQMFMLEGSAGTGKTTCVQTLLREAAEKAFVLSAPTNKATKVLREMSEKEGVSAICRTIYSLLGLRVTKDSEFVQVEPVGDSDVMNFDVVIVDEASMVNSRLFEFMADAAAASTVKFIFMGDPLQLPPVGEASSPTFSVKLKFTLTKVERHDNQILTFATSLRECILRGVPPVFKSDSDDKGGVFCVDWRRMQKQIEKAYTSDSYLSRQGSIKTIAWRNATVANYNAIVRKALYGERADVEDFILNERVVATHAVAQLDDEMDIRMVTDEEADVVALQTGPHPMFPDIHCYWLTLESEFSDLWAHGFVVHATSRKTYDNLLNRLAEQARKREVPWSSFWGLKNVYLHDIRPCHAITAHRSQGSTYESTFVDVEDIMANRDRSEALRCLYVAATRAQRVLVMKTR